MFFVFAWQREAAAGGTNDEVHSADTLVEAMDWIIDHQDDYTGEWNILDGESGDIYTKDDLSENFNT